MRPDESILDIGSGNGAALECFNVTNPIVAVDVEPKESVWLTQPNVTFQLADGTCLPFSDRAFPVAFSNSVIAHVPEHRWSAFAHEVARVADRYFVQTPNRWFPIEPCSLVPFVHFLPARWRRALNKRFTAEWLSHGHDCSHLTARQLRHLFPDAKIHRERVLGLTKSLIAVRR